MTPQERKVFVLALEALKANHLLIHGSETKGGLSFCMDGYYSGCFDIDSNDKQTNEAITAIEEALAQPEYQSTADKSKLEKVPAKGTLLAQSEHEFVRGECVKCGASIERQEPVTHTLNCVCGAVWDIKTDGSEEMVHTPYTTPPQRKPLTDEQKMALCKQFPDHLTFNAIHAIEAAHNIKE